MCLIIIIIILFINCFQKQLIILKFSQIQRCRDEESTHKEKDAGKIRSRQSHPTTKAVAGTKARQLNKSFSKTLPRPHPLHNYKHKSKLHEPRAIFPTQSHFSKP